ncbi:hypothetical protein CRENBAI_014056 [Crenichthys baileyi]|uniref:Uncharacterized protein n=1 Tax=Crenichthys baileyi TaxID=28760 RepID=A0AAV9RZ01_9TELE
MTNTLHTPALSRGEGRKGGRDGERGEEVEEDMRRGGREEEEDDDDDERAIHSRFPLVHSLEEGRAEPSESVFAQERERRASCGKVQEEEEEVVVVVGVT